VGRDFFSLPLHHLQVCLNWDREFFSVGRLGRKYKTILEQLTIK
jgi:hypothetical protein